MKHPGIVSACCGVIKQSGGRGSVRSEPARGVVFKIHPPQLAAGEAAPGKQSW
jgi:hypothetical protein